jgi:Zn-dependent M16 (insulinase) family peptidase
LVESFQTLKYLDKLDTFQVSDWNCLINKYFLSAKYVCVVGMPSRSCAEQLQNEEESRVKSQIEQIGPEGLKKLEDDLEKAKRVNEREIPPEILESFPVPSLNTVNFIGVSSFTYPFKENEKIPVSFSIDKNAAPVPFNILFDNIKSSFVQISIYLNTANIPDELRLYLEIFQDLFFNMPMKQNGIEISWDNVVKQLETDIVKYSNSLGLNAQGIFSVGDFGQLFILRLQAETEKFPVVLEWWKKLSSDCFVTTERILVSVNKLLNSVAEVKRNGMRVRT